MTPGPHTALVVIGSALAVVGAARSTWSPCGRSMLSSINPVGEAGRGRRFGPTAAWFVTGAVAGGACLGAALAVLAAAVHRLGGGGGAEPTPPAVSGTVAAVLLVALAVDAGRLGPPLPYLRRQVNEVWLDRYRPWVYGAGFGWQIGVGFATFVMTAGLGGLVLAAAATGSPLVAWSLGTAFGAARGLTVLTAAGARTPADLALAQRRLDRAERPVRVAVLAVLAGGAVLTGALAWWPAGVAAGTVALLVAGRRRRAGVAPAT